MNTIGLSERHIIEKGLMARQTPEMGSGLFAERDFDTGEAILWVTLPPGSRSGIIDFKDAFGDCYDRGLTIVPEYVFCSISEHPFWHLNHSCNANAGIANWGFIEERGLPIVAYRPILSGDQIFIDYSPITTYYDGTLDGGPWAMSPCMCGETNCRGVISGFDVLDLETQMQIMAPETGPKGRVLAHILNDVPAVAEALKQKYPELYQEYKATLDQQFALSAQIKASQALWNK